jgi:hypothetical protein
MTIWGTCDPAGLSKKMGALGRLIEGKNERILSTGNDIMTLSGDFYTKKCKKLIKLRCNIIEDMLL